MKVFDLIMIITGIGGAVWMLAIGLSLQLVGRYLKRHHPIAWKTLREPDLNTAQGIRRNRISEWLATDRYLRLGDENLNHWVPFLKKLPLRLGIALAIIFLISATAAALAVKP